MENILERDILERYCIPGLTLLLASWLSWQDLAKFLLHSTRIILIPRSYLITMDKISRL